MPETVDILVGYGLVFGCPYFLAITLILSDPQERRRIAGEWKRDWERWRFRRIRLGKSRTQIEVEG